MADYAIHDTTLIAQANILRKKFGTSDRQNPADYPAKMNLMGALEEKTASGSIVTFSDGADDVPLKSCAVTIAPTLDGVSSVGVVQMGKNLIKPDKYQAASNQLMIGQTNNTSFDTFLKAGTYTISYSTTGESCYIYRREENDESNTNLGKATSKTFTINEDGHFRFWLYGDGAISANISNVQIEVGSTPTQYTAYETPTTHTATLGHTIYGGSVDVVNGTGTDENGNDFTFTPVPIISRLGDNTMWSDGGDLSVVYRSSGTQTLIPPTLISKTVTENGTYTASDDNADGYDEVTVNVQGGGGGNTPEATQTMICDNSALGSTLTFTDDYENYDLIKFVVLRYDAQNTTVFYATPAMLNAMWQYSNNQVNFNQPCTNSYACYQKSSNTSWVRNGFRNMIVQYVYGLTFTNCSVSETALYNRQGTGSSAVTFTPPTGETFFDYDYILFATCTSASDETQLNSEILQPNVEKDIFGSDNVDKNAVRVYTYYNAGKLVTITENTITSYPYFYASGLKLNFNQQNLLGSLNSSNNEELNEELNEEAESEEE